MKINYMGSNQYQQKRRYFTPQPMWKLTRVNWKDFAVVAAAAFIVTIIGVEHRINLKREHVNDSMSWVKKAKAAELSTYAMPELATVETRDEVKALIRKIWRKDAETGLAIARCESGYRPNALNHNTNGTIDEGVFQANSVHGMPDMQNPTANILYAYNLYRDQGTAPWYSSKHCWEGMVTK